MRRILLLITDLEIGGTPTVVRELAIRLHHPPQVRVDVACLARWGPVADQLSVCGIYVTALNAKGVLDVRVLPRLLRVLQGHDTVFSFLMHANAIAAAAAVVCRDVRFVQAIQTTQPRPRWHWLVQAWAQLAAERIVVPSPSVAHVAEDRSFVPHEKIVVIPNAIEPAEFPDQSDRPVAEPPRIGFIGRLDPIKRIPDLLEAARLLGNARLHLFGDGSERGRLEEIVRHDGLESRVTFHGAVQRPQDALAMIDVLVLPSQAEGFGLVLIEAMAAGVPVVATNVPGICDVVRDGATGLLAPVASPGMLAKQIDRALQDLALRQRLIATARDEVKAKFSWAQALGQYEQLLNLAETPLP
jgi:glycosyltransferase involved in cell wall biosynthesis